MRSSAKKHDTKVDGELVNEGRLLGNQVAFRRFYREHRDAVCRTVTHILGPRLDHHDVVQNVFLIAWEQREKLRRLDEARPWLREIARRCAWAHCRKDRNYVRRIRSFGANHRHLRSHHANPEAQWIAGWTAARLMSRVSPEDRELFRRAEFEGETGLEIGRNLGLNPNTVRSRLHAVRRRLRLLALEAAPERPNETYEALRQEIQRDAKQKDRELAALLPLLWPSSVVDASSPDAAEAPAATRQPAHTPIGTTTAALHPVPTDSTIPWFGFAAAAAIVALIVGVGLTEMSAPSDAPASSDATTISGRAQILAASLASDPPGAPVAGTHRADAPAVASSQTTIALAKTDRRGPRCGRGLRAELELVRPAFEAQRDGEWDRAKRLLRRHARCFPIGQLADERDAARAQMDRGRPVFRASAHEDETAP
ncbi:MAG: sigma-70 family RNA polymerase sigma factor [Myxococcales bacterium FL481]|nr:MAG: sigma-70 family RNA polymerase sigma factor [Myxococcales bacterium FL481]